MSADLKPTSITDADRTFYLDLAFVDTDELGEWLAEFEPRGRMARDRYNGLPPTMFRVRFSDDADAVEFKLRWSEQCLSPARVRQMFHAGGPVMRDVRTTDLCPCAACEMLRKEGRDA